MAGALIQKSIARIASNNNRERDSAAYEAMEVIRAGAIHAPAWGRMAPFIDTARYMVSEDEHARRRLARMPPPDFEAKRRKLIAAHKAEAEHGRIELAGQLWLLDRKQPIENVIYYKHTGVFCWGWRAPLADQDVSAVLDYISEFPFPYEIKGADGRTLAGGLPAERAEV
jgi:hypothetical protein